MTVQFRMHNCMFLQRTGDYFLSPCDWKNREQEREQMYGTMLGSKIWNK